MQDPLWIKSLLAVHITAGITAFVMAPLALATAKGGKAHRRWGKIYFWAMAVVASTALVLALYRPVLFLALVAVFSFYAAYAAYRVLFYKDLPHGANVAWPDWAAAIFTFASSFTLALLGVARPALVQHLGIPAMVFGIIGMALAGKSMRLFLRPPKEKMFWWYEHLGGMLASYIAAWTACKAFSQLLWSGKSSEVWFSWRENHVKVGGFGLHPLRKCCSVTTIGRFVHGGWVIWVLPTFIGVPAISMTTAYYKRKFAPRTKIDPATAA